MFQHLMVLLSLSANQGTLDVPDPCSLLSPLPTGLTCATVPGEVSLGTVLKSDVGGFTQLVPSATPTQAPLSLPKRVGHLGVSAGVSLSDIWGLLPPGSLSARQAKNVYLAFEEPVRKNIDVSAAMAGEVFAPATRRAYCESTVITEVWEAKVNLIVSKRASAQLDATWTPKQVPVEIAAEAKVKSNRFVSLQSASPTVIAYRAVRLADAAMGWCGPCEEAAPKVAMKSLGPDHPWNDTYSENYWLTSEILIPPACVQSVGNPGSETVGFNDAGGIKRPDGRATDTFSTVVLRHSDGAEISHRVAGDVHSVKIALGIKD